MIGQRKVVLGFEAILWEKKKKTWKETNGMFCLQIPRYGL